MVARTSRPWSSVPRGLIAGRRRGGRARQVVVDRAVAEADEGPDHVALRLDQGLDLGIAVVGVRCRTRPRRSSRSSRARTGKVEAMVVDDEEGHVVGDELGEEAEAEEGEEYPQGDVASPVRLEAAPALAAQGAQASVRPHVCLVSKSMRGSTKV